MVIFPIPKQVDFLEGKYSGNRQPIRRDNKSFGKEEYEIDVTSEGIYLTSSCDEGNFRAQTTLKQILAQSEDGVPCLHIHDYPDHEIRGFTYCTWNRFPTQDELYRQVDILADMKINQLHLYLNPRYLHFEQFPFLREKATHPISHDEIRALDKYCKERYIELIPFMDMFGHFNFFLEDPEIAKIAERPDSTSLNPVDPRSIETVSRIFDELVPLFSGKYIHTGCDEALQLGTGASKEACEKYGKDRVFVDFVNKLNDNLNARGKLMQYWADILVERCRPEVIATAPDNAIALNWGYRRYDVRAELCRNLQVPGKPFCCSATTWVWSTIFGRTEEMMLNVDQCSYQTKQHGGLGTFITDWSDYIIAMFTMSLFPIAYSASSGWNAPNSPIASGLGGAIPDPDALQAGFLSPATNACFDYLDTFVYKDRRHQMAHLAFDAGRINNQCRSLKNEFNYLLAGGYMLDWDRGYNCDKYDFITLHDYADTILHRISHVDMACDDADLIRQEYIFGAELLKYVSYYGMYKKGYYDGLTQGSFEKMMREKQPMLKEMHKDICLRRIRGDQYKLADSLFEKFKA